jgi:hypothetical protein
MKSGISLLVIFSFVCLLGFSSPVYAAAPLDGIMGIPWGASANEVVAKVRQAGCKNYRYDYGVTQNNPGYFQLIADRVPYERTGDLLVDKLDWTCFMFLFKDNKFISVRVQLTGGMRYFDTSYENLKRNLSYDYGPGRDTGDGTNRRYEWNLSSSRGEQCTLSIEAMQGVNTIFVDYANITLRK